MTSRKNVLILDSEPLVVVDGYDDVIYWSSYTNSEMDRIFSLPLLVERNDKNLRSKYLELIYEFGHSMIFDKQIIEYLEIRPNFSHWWMTLLAEKCNYSKSPNITNIIKLIELNRWLKENKYSGIYLVTDNKDLINAMSLLSRKLKINFKWKKKEKVKPHAELLMRIFSSLPYVLQQVIWLLYYLIRNWPLKGVGLKEWKESTGTTTFVSYLFNNKPEVAGKGRYGSYYWTDLVDLLNKKEHSTNWLHFYIKDKVLPTARHARDAIKKFNQSKNSNQCHVALASFIDINLIFNVIKDSYKIAKLAKNTGIQIKTKSDYLWPLIEKDFKDSMKGVSAISNILYFNLFEKAMNCLPRQNKGFYLQENQGWEFGFISAWKSSGHNNHLIGIPHSTIRYWDLRYFFDKRQYKKKDSNSMPMPDFIGANGRVSKNMLLDSGYPKNFLIELEALRYLYLLNFNAYSANKKNSRNKKTVLIVGDYLKENTNKQLELLSSAMTNIDKMVDFIIKSHPGYTINLDDFPNISGTISTESIDKLLMLSDVVYSSSTTSAVVDAYYADVPVIAPLDGKILNMSPLRGNKNIHFVTSARGLSVAINNVVEIRNKSKGVKDFFYLDDKMTMWEKCLEDG